MVQPSPPREQPQPLAAQYSGITEPLWANGALDPQLFPQSSSSELAGALSMPPQNTLHPYSRPRTLSSTSPTSPTTQQTLSYPPPGGPSGVAYPPSPNHATLTNPRLGPSRPPPAISSSLLRAIAQRYHGTEPERTPLHNPPPFVPALVGSMQWRTFHPPPAHQKVRVTIHAVSLASAFDDCA